MDRFDDMRSKGLNTYDADATTADILEGKTAYVAGQKIIGTLQQGTSGGFGSVGVPVTAQPTIPIEKGDVVYGIKNENITVPTVGSSTIPINAIWCDDCSVGYEEKNLGDSTTSIDIFIKNGDYYNSVTVPLTFETGEWASSGYNRTPCTKMDINTDGTIVGIVTQKKIRIIEVDKENITFNLIEIPLANVELENLARFGTSIAFVGNLVCFMTSLNGTASTYTCYIGKYTSNGFITDIKLLYADNYVFESVCYLEEYDKYLLTKGSVTAYSQLFEIKIFSDGSYTVSSSIHVSGQEEGMMSKNGKYICNYNKLYRLDRETLTVTQIATLGFITQKATTWVDSTGQYIFYYYNQSTSGIYRVSDGKMLISIFERLRGKFFEIVDDYCIIGNSKYSLADSDEAEYIVTPTKNMVDGANMYGIANENIDVNEVGKVQLLFNVPETIEG